MMNNFVISIAGASERRKHILNQFATQQIPFSFFDALTPSTQLTDLLNQYLPNVAQCSHLTMGEKGCLMSHFMLWQKCLNEPYDYLAIFEDDILLAENSIVLLNNNDWLTERFSSEQAVIIRLETFLMPVKLSETAIADFQGRRFTNLESVHFGTAGYIISRAAASYLIGLLGRLSETEIEPIDHLIFNRYLNDENYHVYQLNPAPCVQELQYHQEHSCLTSGLEKERQTKQSTKPRKTLKQRLMRIKDNILRALNKKKWQQKQLEKAMQGKQIVYFR